MDRNLFEKIIGPAQPGDYDAGHATFTPVHPDGVGETYPTKYDALLAALKTNAELRRQGKPYGATIVRQD